MINPEYLKTFLTLVETGHFTKTAERLHMTQPGVSQHIKKLEAHFETELIHRQGKKFSLTESGKKLVAYGKKLFDEYNQFENVIAIDDPHEGTCRYSSPGSFGFQLFDALTEASQTFQRLETSLIVAPNSSIPNLLLERKIDVGFMSEKSHSPLLESKSFHKEELLLLMPKNFRFKGFACLESLGFVDHPDGLQMASRLLSLNFPEEFDRFKKIRRRIFVNQISRILDPVKMGLGFTVLPQGAFLNYHDRKNIQSLRLKKRVLDEIYKVTRRSEMLPARYQTIELILLSNLKSL